MKHIGHIQNNEIRTDRENIKAVHIIVDVNKEVRLTDEIIKIILTDISECSQNYNLTVEKIAVELEPHVHFHILATGYSEKYVVDRVLEQFKRICGRKIQQLSGCKVKKTFTYTKVNIIRNQEHYTNAYKYIDRKNNKYSTNLI